MILKRKVDFDLSDKGNIDLFHLVTYTCHNKKKKVDIIIARIIYRNIIKPMNAIFNSLDDL